MTTVRWGILSTADIGMEKVTPAIQGADNCEVVAIASRSQASADAAAARLGIPTAYGSYEALLADDTVDAVYIPLPNDMHAEWTMKAAAAGKHILCEKPLAMNAAQAEEMAAACDEAGVKLSEAFMYRHHPQTLKVKDLVDKGVIGDLQLIRGSFTFYLDREGDIRLYPEMGGGSIWDVGCYPISYARTIAGSEPEEVFGWQVSSDLDIDLIFAGQMCFPGNVYAQFDSGFRSPYRVYFQIVGSEGSITVPQPFNPKENMQFTIDNIERVETVKIDGMMLYLGEVEDMADAILLGKPTRVSLTDSRANVAAILALLKSAREGGPVKL